MLSKFRQWPAKAFQTGKIRAHSNNHWSHNCSVIVNSLKSQKSQKLIHLKFQEGATHVDWHHWHHVVWATCCFQSQILMNSITSKRPMVIPRLQPLLFCGSLEIFVEAQTFIWLQSCVCGCEMRTWLNWRIFSMVDLILIVWKFLSYFDLLHWTQSADKHHQKVGRTLALTQNHLDQVQPPWKIR